ncbi:sphingomyelin phosphodiesterase 4-like [Stylophora pistillata]|uniref:sphingomyelin phosphodiesterase 4-like n=1 Tax=Stylophora pistillata TaxID=50429 RepID=UPI000C04F544|nr:sphingomyelin phosphodiesterase 4-like [Stylophora pistillata]
MSIDVFKSKTREALQKPLCQRCEEIEKLIEASSTQNLHGFFPQLLSSIFGYAGSGDWGLKTLKRNSKDFATVHQFLSPGGAVFKLIDMLQADELKRYEFFISCLPISTQKSLSEGMIPVLYRDKVPVRTPGGKKNTVLLNTFEYYMFHFAYYILHQQVNRESSSMATQDFLYLIVLDDYLNFFLPSDEAAVSRSTLKTKSPTSSVRKSANCQTRCSFRGMIKPSTGRVSPPTAHHGMFDHSSQEIWRSKKFLQILIEFWLNQNTVDSISRNVLSHSQEYFMPTLDHVRVVRILVKHIHTFVYAKVSDVAQLSVLHPYDELRSIIIPQFLQKKLYFFLCHCFSHWPLDPSFKYVLETWLSYIQPWRYSKNQPGSVVSGDDESREAGPEWKSFVFENLLFYSALLFEFVSRACRFNLTSSKDVHLLFRVMKVFAQTHLVDMIEEGEKSFLNPSGNHRTSSQVNSNTLSSAIKAHIFELEGSPRDYDDEEEENFQMRELCTRVLAALHEAQAKNQTAQESEGNRGGISGFLRNFFNHGDSQGNESERKDEDSKVLSYLKQTKKILPKIVRDAESIDGSALNSSIQWEIPSSINRGRHTSAPGSQSSLPDHLETERGPVLTPLGRNGLRKFPVRYSGDPELTPICSFENSALVRLMYKLSTHLNEKVADVFVNFYISVVLLICYVFPFQTKASKKIKACTGQVVWLNPFLLKKNKFSFNKFYSPYKASVFTALNWELYSLHFGKSLDKLYINSRLFRQAACFFSPALKSLSSSTPSRQSSTSPSRSPQEPIQLQISLRVFASYRTLLYLFLLWLFFHLTSMNVFLVILLWILVLITIVLNHLTPCHKKSLEKNR